MGATGPQGEFLALSMAIAAAFGHTFIFAWTQPSRLRHGCANRFSPEADRDIVSSDGPPLLTLGDIACLAIQHSNGSMVTAHKATALAGGALAGDGDT